MIIVEAIGKQAKNSLGRWARGDRLRKLKHLFVRHLGNGTYVLRDCSESLLFADYARRLYPGEVEVLVAERLFDWEIPDEITKSAKKAADNPKSYKDKGWSELVNQLPKTQISLKKEVSVNE